VSKHQLQGIEFVTPLVSQIRKGYYMGKNEIKAARSLIKNWRISASGVSKGIIW